MLASLSGALRLALVLGLGAGVFFGDAHQHVYAQSDDEDDDSQEDEDEDEDEDGGDEYEEEGEGEEEEEDEADKEQPPVTAGGLYTLKTFPIRENERPLTITQNIAQVRLGIGTDVSNKGAFESAGVTLEGLYGYRDNFMLLGGMTSAYNFQQFNLYGGFEGALAYDFIDFRLLARIGRTAFNESTNIETVDYQGSDIKMAVDIGFPFRYVARPELAIVALQSVMSIDFNETGDCMADPTTMALPPSCNEVKPDLNPSLAIVTNPVPPVSLVIQATLKVVDFDFTNNLEVPATIRIQFSPNRKLDIGAEFTLLNVKPTDPDDDGPAEAPGAFDNRFLSLFIASRFGK